MDNKDIAVSFLKMASNGQTGEAYAQFIGKEFRHHSPFFAGTAEALQAAMEENARKNPNKVFEVKRVISEGD